MAIVTEDTMKGRFGSLREAITEKAPRQGVRLAEALERQTVKVPVSGFMGLALGSMIASAAVQIFGRTHEAKVYGTLIGLLAPTFLLMGIYNKFVEIEQIEEKVR